MLHFTPFNSSQTVYGRSRLTQLVIFIRYETLYFGIFFIIENETIIKYDCPLKCTRNRRANSMYSEKIISCYLFENGLGTLYSQYFPIFDDLKFSTSVICHIYNII